MARVLLLLTFLIGVYQSALAQEDVGVAYGVTITGDINNATPRAAYYFDGQRGEVISITLRVTAGDLDPVLTVVSSQGEIIAAADDSRGSRAPSLPALRVPQSERYYVVIGRFGYALGTTSGSYELDIERVGVSSASGTMLRYGDQVINSITDMNPQLYYSFRAQQGDIVNIRMRRVSGDLDSYLQVVSSETFVIADNDDTPGLTTPFDAQINGLVIEESGTYVIIASRYGQAAGTSTGNFVLILEEAAGSGLANSPQTALALQPGQTVEGALTDDQFTQYYVFEARANDLVSVRMSRKGGALDSLVAIADANLQELVIDDDSAGNQNAQIAQYKIPADGTYYVIATRFDRAAGTTTGAYTLELVDLGSAFDDIPEGVPRIGYGSTITGVIDDSITEVTYAFWGEAGDVITVSMNRLDGNLDPLVSILDGEQRPLVSDDDSGSGQNAHIDRYELPTTGAYYVRATRFSGEPPGDPNTSGSYNLTLARRFN